MSPEDHVKTTQYQGLVVKQLTKGGEVVENGGEDGGKSIEVLLEEGLRDIKDIALSNKKTGNTDQNRDRRPIRNPKILNRGRSTFYLL